MGRTAGGMMASVHGLHIRTTGGSLFSVVTVTNQQSQIVIPFQNVCSFVPRASEQRESIHLDDALALDEPRVFRDSIQVDLLNEDSLVGIIFRVLLASDAAVDRHTQLTVGYFTTD